MTESSDFVKDNFLSGLLALIKFLILLQLVSTAAQPESCSSRSKARAAELSALTGNFLVHQIYFSKVIQINSGPGRDAI